MDIKRGYMGRYEERLAQQESGAALSNCSTYVSGLLLYKVYKLEPIEGLTHATQTEETCH